jgi:hypothetical protein
MAHQSYGEQILDKLFVQPARWADVDDCNLHDERGVAEIAYKPAPATDNSAIN